MSAVQSPRDPASPRPTSIHRLLASSVPAPPKSFTRAADPLPDFDEIEPFSPIAYIGSNAPAVQSLVGGTSLLRRHRQTSYLTGISLPSVLQMLSIEHKTCVIEISSDNRHGAFTLVEGELVDAQADGTHGELAAYRMLGWTQPQVVISEGTTYCQRTVQEPLEQILIQAVRLQDEGFLADSMADQGTGSLIGQPTPRDWDWLAETLVLSGATAAAIVTLPGEEIVASAQQESSFTPAETDLDDLFSIGVAARLWSRLISPTVEELIVRVQGKVALIRPVEAAGQAFAFAMVDDETSLDLIRSAIRALNHTELSRPLSDR